MEQRFSMPKAPARQERCFVENGIRFSVISDRILRVEKGAYTDCRTQVVFCRDFADPDFNVTKSQDKLSIETNFCRFDVDLETLSTKVRFASPLKCGVVEASPLAMANMGGTARTLDGTFGVLGGFKGKREKKDHFFLGHLRKGIFATNGVTELDDSSSFLLLEDGSVAKREEGVDKYILAFGDDYLYGLKEFFKLTGAAPVIPKYALSNWWSRYHAYSDVEYLALMDKFESKDVPLTVATIDMDWHRVSSVPKDAEYRSMQGRGWTGYSFEKSLFPDHKGFLHALKQRGLAVTMNLHPRDGVRYFEDMYEDMARAVGVDPATKQTVRFDLTDRRFLCAYFDILHHPYEADGVDFWWIDWQQGTKSEMEGLDPLWLLNHYHFLDNCRDGKRGLILSRFAGLGSHRYPLGFSGDTFVCWRSLRFQPYFTALAANAGYTWWSHDIGGHLMGVGDQGLYLRWLQFGVFSPINRLHSNNKGRSKEPWIYPKVESIAEDFMRLRHRLLPFLYTASVRTNRDGVPLVSPMYYFDDDPRSRSKKYRNQYYFGESMLVCPMCRKGTRLKVWLPKGEWYDFFTGEKIVGDREFVYDCPLDRYPVFVKSGSVVPMLPARKGNSMAFDALELRLYPFGEGEKSAEYTLFDEEGSLKATVTTTDGGVKIALEPRGICTKEVRVTNEKGEPLGTISLDGEPCTLCVKCRA